MAAEGNARGGGERAHRERVPPAAAPAARTAAPCAGRAQPRQRRGRGRSGGGYPRATRSGARVQRSGAAAPRVRGEAAQGGKPRQKERGRAQGGKRLRPIRRYVLLWTQGGVSNVLPYRPPFFYSLIFRHIGLGAREFATPFRPVPRPGLPWVLRMMDEMWILEMRKQPEWIFQVVRGRILFQNSVANALGPDMLYLSFDPL